MENSIELCKKVAKESPKALVSFSMGKDSIAAYIQMERYFERVDLVFLYMVPGLEFQEQALAYYEAKFKRRIIRMPNPTFYSQLWGYMYQPPQNIDKIEALDIYRPNYQEIFAAAKHDLGFPQECFVGTGVRSADSLARRAACLKTGGINRKKKHFWPVWDWNIEKTRQEIRASGIKLPVDYKIWGRTFDGFDYRFLKPLKDHFPKDYEKIREFFPLVDLEILRYGQRL